MTAGDGEPSSEPFRPAAGPLHRWTVAVGAFFFRNRNAVFPLVFALMVLLLRPRVLGSPAVDHWLVVCGAVVALLGEGVRLATIGFEYIERGGKEGKVYASRLVQGGIYAHTRNPMYLGNLMIAIGMTMATGAPAAYAVIIPAFLFIYLAITSTEEEFLRNQFGREYEDYCARVPRFFPSLRGLGRTLLGMRYNWKRSLRQDLSTLVGLLLGLSLLPVWRTFFLHGFAAANAIAPRAFGLSGGILAGYWAVYWLKKHGRLQ